MWLLGLLLDDLPIINRRPELAGLGIAQGKAGIRLCQENWPESGSPKEPIWAFMGRAM